MNRRPNNQDISWFLDLYNRKQLDLEPPYQRRSVWTLKDRKFFLDTILRNYPSPAIFLHKTMSDNGVPVYHVVDGKQRLETIIKFVNNEIRISTDFGDENISGKKWQDFDSKSEIKKKFWDYVLSVEFLDTVDGIVVNEVFDRLNRNSRKLERQELRHAKFEGWFISTAEMESEKDEWTKLGIVTAARAKRMKDVQFISELMLVLLDGRIVGFDQDYLDQQYAAYDDIQEMPAGFAELKFAKKMQLIKTYLISMETINQCISDYASNFGNFYTLWSVLALSELNKLKPGHVADVYAKFMSKVEKVAAQKDIEKFLKHKGGEYAAAAHYFRHSLSASTDLSPREERAKVLTSILGF